MCVFFGKRQKATKRRSSLKMPTLKVGSKPRGYGSKSIRCIWILCLTGETSCNGGSPSCRTISPRAESGADLSHPVQDKREWLLSGLFQEPAGWLLSPPRFAPSSALLPSCLPSVVTTNKSNGASNHLEPWLSSRVWAGVSSIRAVNYSPLIYSSQNANCSPWHNLTSIIHCCRSVCFSPSGKRG